MTGGCLPVTFNGITPPISFHTYAKTSLFFFPLVITSVLRLSIHHRVSGQMYRVSEQLTGVREKTGSPERGRRLPPQELAYKSGVGREPSQLRTTVRAFWSFPRHYSPCLFSLLLLVSSESFFIFEFLLIVLLFQVLHFHVYLFCLN